MVMSNLEARNSLENPRIPLSDPNALAALWGAWASDAGIEVTVDRALGVPAVWCAVNFISGTLASLPLLLFKQTAEGRVRDDGNPLYSILHDEVNDDLVTSFAWRKYSMVNTLLRGRSFTFIERNGAKAVRNLWPLNPLSVTIERVNGRKQYRYRENGKEFVYRSDEIIDIPFMLGVDGISAIDPVARLTNALGLAIALERYASKFFQNGGVPPLAMQMPAGTTAGASRRGTLNIEELIKQATEEGRLVLPMPDGHRLEQIGFNPESGQLIAARRFQTEEIARIYGLPPIFLQDLERATYTNAEQQDLHFVKHSLTQWLECWEQELNAKLLGPRSKSIIEFNIDGLLRGDFATRMAGYATAVQNAILAPDEIREMENREKKGGQAGDLLIQGATVPLGQQLTAASLSAPQKRDLMEFTMRMAAAALGDDVAALNSGMIEATTELREGRVTGQLKARVVLDLYPRKD